MMNPHPKNINLNSSPSIFLQIEKLNQNKSPDIITY
jgi:hypothetical protein